jgi:hypothetical protein
MQMMPVCVQAFHMRRPIVVASMAIQILLNELEILERLFIGVKREYSMVTKHARSAQLSGRKEATLPEAPDVERIELISFVMVGPVHFALWKKVTTECKPIT